MKISKDLNLVVPVETEAGTFYVHSVPIRTEVFKQYYLVLSKTLNRVHTEGIQVVGPRVAALMLQEIAEESGKWDGVTGVKNGLMNEIRRSSNILMPTSEGWKSVPLADALKQEYLTEREVDEVEGFIVFFTCVLHIHKRNETKAMLILMERAWDTQTTSLNCSEYRDSLPKSIAIETFVPTVKQSSVPG